MNVAVCQFAAGPDPAANARTCAALIAQAAAAGADLAVLPEVAMFFDPKHQAGPGPHGEPLDGPFATAIAAAARQSAIAVVVGMVEQASGDARDHNTLLAVGPDGARIGSYRKIHLYDAFGFRESDIYRPGPIDAPLVFPVAGITVGALTCYDLRFPEAFRWVVDAGADLVLLPAAWMAGPAKERHWATLLAARAIENTIYLAAAGQTGPACCGQSMIIDPMGTILACVGEQPGLAVAPIDRDRIDQVRAVNPSLANRRFSIAARHQ